MKGIESSALNAIQTHLIKTLNSRLNYKRKCDKEKNKYLEANDKTFQPFWDECFQNYLVDIKNFCTETDELHSSETKGDSSSIVDYGSLFWQTPLDTLKQAYISVWESLLEDMKSKAKCDKLFYQLCEILEMEIKNSEQPPTLKMSKRGKIFDRVPQMLNLYDKNICSLLPYLMTAYIFHYPTCQFLYNKKPFLNQVFDDTDIDSTAAPKIRSRIKKFSYIFSLSGAKLGKTLCSDRSNQSHPQPSVKLSAYAAPLTTVTEQDIIVLNHIFNFWCKNIAACVAKNRLDIKIDINLCEGLYKHYCGVI